MTFGTGRQSAAETHAPSGDHLPGVGAADTNLRALLPSESWVPIRAFPVKGRVVWVDFDLARARGFDVPADNRMTPALHRELIARLAFKTGDDEPSTGRSLEGWADRYRVLGSRGGSGRAFFLPTGECVKGGGATPLVLCRWDPKHSNGLCPMREGVLEAVWGKVSANLFRRGGSRVLAVIDVGDTHRRADSGKVEPDALIIRCQNPVRPAHVTTGFLDATGCDRERLQQITEARSRAGMRDPPLDEAHAQAAAEQLRWRVLHGALNDSNMGLHGEMLDFGTPTTLPRTAPQHVLPPDLNGLEHVGSYLFRKEQSNRAQVLRALGAAARWKGSYAAAKDVQLLRACGLKAELAEALRREDPSAVRTFRKRLWQISKYHNGASLDTTRDRSEASEEAGVFDLFNLLARAPALLETGALNPSVVAALLEPLAPREATRRGHESWRNTTPVAKYAVSSATRVEQLGREFASWFAEAYPALLEKAERLAVDQGHAGDAQDFRASLKARAAFENRPILDLQRGALNARIDAALQSYQTSGDPAPIQELINNVTTRSLRDVDAILRQGGRRSYTGGLSTQRATIDAIAYEVRVADSGARTLRITVPRSGADARTRPGAPSTVLRLRDFLGRGDCSIRGEIDADGRHLVFDVPVEPHDVGYVDGVLESTPRSSDRGSERRLPLWVFAVPDATDVARMKM